MCEKIHSVARSTEFPHSRIALVHLAWSKPMLINVISPTSSTTTSTAAAAGAGAAAASSGIAVSVGLMPVPRRLSRSRVCGTSRVTSSLVGTQFT